MNLELRQAVHVALVALLAGTLTGCCHETARSDRAEPAGDARVGPACDDLVDSRDCSADKRCCPLPPGLYEAPMCLPVCTDQPEIFCRDLLGGIAECNPEAGCCHFPKTLSR